MKADRVASPRPSRAPWVIALLAVFAAGALPAASQTARPVWRSLLTPGTMMRAAAATPSLVFTTGSTGTYALDARTAATRWSAETEGTTLVVDADSVYLGDVHGGVSARRLDDGRTRWQRAAVCTRPRYAPSGNVGFLVTIKNALMVGCTGGGVARLDPTTGEVLAHSETFLVDNIQEITPLGSCAFGVAGYSSGAHLVEHSEIVDCRTLKTIRENGDEATILGAVGDTAFVNDGCCFGRSGAPAAVYQVDLRNGSRSPDIELVPEPGRYPPSSRVIGEYGALALIGRDVYIGVGHTLYRYRDLARSRNVPQPEIIADGLVEPPAFLAPNVIRMLSPATNGLNHLRVVRVVGTRLNIAAEFDVSATDVIGYDFAPFPIYVTIGDAMQQTYLRLSDGQRLVVPNRCNASASAEDLLVAICTLPTIVGNRNLQELVAYRWSGKP